ncbi:MAG: tRNA pseudouridine38-40 synthase [Abditibacteriota bacterium]|nr:tRNA pseudouridine38-40 synthase [Abditibacteriota bacterium]
MVREQQPENDSPEALPTDFRSPATNHRFIAGIVAYDGTAFCGSQRQKNGRSVQGDLEVALAAILKHEAPVILAGRTDAGVHASGQVFRFTTTNAIPANRVALALNTVLARDVRVKATRAVEERFHPRFSASSRVYKYIIEDVAIVNPMLRQIAGNVRETLDVRAMNTACRVFWGRQDFAAWQSAGSPTKTTVREIKKLSVRRRRDIYGSSPIEVTIEADAFLYQMVRNIVGALIAVGKGELSADDVERLTRGADRTQCPPPAPPQGLCLMQVKYENGNS